MRWALVAWLGVGSAVACVLRLPPPSGVERWLGLLAAYAGLAALGSWRMHRLGVLRQLLRFRPGDLSLGIGIGACLVVSAWALSSWLMPLDSVGHAWLVQAFLLVGAGPSAPVSVCLLAIAVAQELVWRGWVQAELSQRFGVRRAWLLAALLYAAAHAPTLVTLADARSGANPVIVLTALGCGLCWGFLRERTGRLVPGAFSHLAFSYLASQYLGRFYDGSGR